MFTEYQCICSSRQLFLGGCSCGAWKAAQADEAARRRVEAYTVRQETLAQRDYLIKAPTAPVTFKVVCACGHYLADHHPGFCDELGCICRSWNPA